MMRLLALLGACQVLTSKEKRRFELDEVDDHHRRNAIIGMPPEMALLRFTLLEKWVAVPRLETTVSRWALGAIAESGHPRATDVLIGELDGPLRWIAFGGLGTIASPAACELLVAAWVAGPEPDALEEDMLFSTLNQRLVVPKCVTELKAAQQTHPERVGMLHRPRVDP